MEINDDMIRVVKCFTPQATVDPSLLFFVAIMSKKIAVYSNDT